MKSTFFTAMFVIFDSKGGNYLKQNWKASLFRVIVVISTIAGGMAVPFNAVVNAAVYIPDPNLRAVIETELGKPSSIPITTDEMATLIHIDAQELNILDLTGLESATNLTTLNLSENQITEILPLTGLKNLEVLYLWDNQITDILPLVGLTNLTRLDLSRNQITDPSPLAGLANLTKLNLLENNIQNISALVRLTNLTELNLSNNKISFILPLVDNTGLGSGDNIDISENPLSSISSDHIQILQNRGVSVQR